MGEWNWFSPGPDQYWTQRRSTWAPKWDSGSKEWNRRQDVSSNYHLAIWKLCINLTTSLALCFLQNQLDRFGHYIKKTDLHAFNPSAMKVSTKIWKIWFIWKNISINAQFSKKSLLHPGPLPPNAAEHCNERQWAQLVSLRGADKGT